MDFFESQAAARRRTALLVVYYLLATLILVPLVYLVALGSAVPVRTTVNFFREWYDLHDTYTPIPHPGWWDARLFAWAAVCTLTLMAAGTLYRLWQVSKGGYVVAELLGGQRIDPRTKSPEQRQLVNVVEEMAIASGMPVPDVYLLKGQPGINAFAAGLIPEVAVIGVTQGCLANLTRDELQAVVAHEFSHILHGDTRLKTILVGLLHGLVYLGVLSNEACLRTARGEPAAVAAAFFVFVVLGFVTLPLLFVTQVGIGLATVIKRMVSRQREFLADAAAVQFTRNGDAVAAALKKLGGYTAGSRILSTQTAGASHFFFASAAGGALWSWPWLSSHPPLAERVRRLEPGFSGDFSYVPPKPVAPRPPAPGPAGAILEKALNFEVNPEALAGTIGAPTAEHVVLAGALLAAVPAGVAENVRDPIGAVGVVYGLLISRDPAIRTAQLERLGQAASPAVTAATQKAMVMLNAVEGRRRLPLAGLAIRSLKSLSPAEYERFHENIHALIAADDNVDLFEFTLQRMILRHLAPAFGQRREGSRVRVRKLGPLMTSCRDLLSCLAYWGSYDVLDQDQAYRKAVAQLAGDPDRAPAMLARKECSVELVGRALDDVAAATPELKKIVMNACVTCIAADGRTSIEEAELLQAIADALDLPLPPIV